MGDSTFAAHLARLVTSKQLLAWTAFSLLAASALIVRLVQRSPIGSLDVIGLFVLTYLGVLLAIILEVYQAVRPPSIRVYTDVAEAWNTDMKHEIEKALRTRLHTRRSDIHWLGVTLGVAWPHLRLVLRPLAQAGMLSNVTVGLSQVNPEYLKVIAPYDSGLPHEAEAMWNEIGSFIAEFTQSQPLNQCEITRARYYYMPTFHGLLINNSVAFVSYVTWDGNKLRVSENRYWRYDNKSEDGDQLIQIFRHWVDKAEAAGTV